MDHFPQRASINKSTSTKAKRAVNVTVLMAVVMSATIDGIFQMLVMCNMVRHMPCELYHYAIDT